MEMPAEENNSLNKNEDENIIETTQKNSEDLEEKKIEISFCQEILPSKVKQKIKITKLID